MSAMVAFVTMEVAPGRPALGLDQITKPVPAAAIAASAAAWIVVRKVLVSDPELSNERLMRGTMYERPIGRRPWTMLFVRQEIAAPAFPA